MIRNIEHENQFTGPSRIDSIAKFRGVNMEFHANFCFWFAFALVISCSANEFGCEFYAEQTKLLTKMCVNSENCLKDQARTAKADQVLALKVTACGNQTVLRAIEAFSSMQRLDISQSNYKSLKWLNLKNNHLQVLNASDNKLAFLPWGFLEHTPALLEIDLSYNALTNLDSKRLFDGAEKLQKIYLAHNSLHSINHDAFSSLPRLQFIDLTGNRFMKVPIFPKNPALTVIRLHDNPITSFDCFHTKVMASSVSVYLNWQNVSAFYGNSYCDNKRMHVFSDANVIGGGGEGVFITSDGKYELHCNANSFKNLRHLIAGRMAFENIDEFVKCFGASIWHLNLSGNRIRSSTISFQRFPTLSSLFLSDTGLTYFDFKWIESLGNLTKLDISYNNLSRLGNAPALHRLEGLQEFNVAGNRLENLQDVIGNLTTSMEKLNLSGSNIGKLNSTIFNRFVALRKLNLSDTNLEFVDMNPFTELTILKSLDISYNNMAQMNFTVLAAPLNQLTEFHASKCQLKSVSKLVKLLGMSLEVLDVSGNAIRSLNAQSFEQLTKLRTLNMSNCDLTYFDSASVQNQLDLRTLDISHNHLQTLNFKRLPTDIRHLNVEANELWKIDNFHAVQFPALRTLAVSKNQLPCDFLKKLKQWHNIAFIGDPFKQKHGQQCHVDAIHLAAAITMCGIFVIVSVYFGIQKILRI